MNTTILQQGVRALFGYRSYGKVRFFPLCPSVFSVVSVFVLVGCAGTPAVTSKVAAAQEQLPKPVAVVPGTKSGKQEIKLAPRIRETLPIRLGGPFTRGLGSGTDPQEESAALGVKLSDENRDWIAANCDVVALDARCLTPETFPAIRKAQRLFTPLLYLYSTSLYEEEGHKGDVGGWQPKMSAWTLRDRSGAEVPFPEKGGHWMDFANKEWAAHWKAQALKLAGQYGAQGAVAAELPLGNTFVGDNLANYKTTADRAAATGDWMEAVHAPANYLLIPSAIGFDGLAGHATPPTPPGTEQGELGGRLWDEYYSLMDGAWAEGWLRPYWAEGDVPEAFWEIQLEAADRAARLGQVFLAAAAYHNPQELEYLLASYLLVAHKQGRFVLQPMPQTPGGPPDAGFSLAVLKQEVAKYGSYFNAPLGAGIQERHQIVVDGGPVWRRAYSNGAVYVNPHASRTVTVPLGGPMRRVTGEDVRQVTLPPHTGVILLNLPKPAALLK